MLAQTFENIISSLKTSVESVESTIGHALKWGFMIIFKVGKVRQKCQINFVAACKL